MSFGFPAYFTESKRIQIQRHEFNQIVKDVLEVLSWNFTEISMEEFNAEIKMNALSWGEKIKIKFLNDGMILAESKCVYPFQCLDWGKNKSNVRTFFSKLNLSAKKVRSFDDQNGIVSAFDNAGFSRLERVLNESEK